MTSNLCHSCIQEVSSHHKPYPQTGLLRCLSPPELSSESTWLMSLPCETCGVQCNLGWASRSLGMGTHSFLSRRGKPSLPVPFWSPLVSYWEPEEDSVCGEKGLAFAQGQKWLCLRQNEFKVQPPKISTTLSNSSLATKLLTELWGGRVHSGSQLQHPLMNRRVSLFPLKLQKVECTQIEEPQLGPHLYSEGP